ncbi:MAG: hypothetical protein IT376_23490 [Polyangiaceae bacterium]|nr:hypothetical protein [Polyangiaceae bacterium]
MRRAALLLGVVAALGCAPELDVPSEVQSLRVLGVQKSKPYARPGEAVDLAVLWHDGRPPELRTPVEVAWFSGCVNPPADLFYGCFQSLAEAEPPAPGAPPPPGFGFGTGDTFAVTLPADVLSSRPPPTDPEIVPYGTAFVFFAVCGGTIEPGTAADGFPLVCRGPSGALLGSRDFVAGYSTIYAYESVSNANPAIGGFRFNGVDVDTDCVGVDCLGPDDTDPQCSATGATPCVDACAADGDPAECPGYSITPVLDPSIVEPDRTQPSRGYSEQLWIAYYVERGSVDRELRLVSDAVKGWRPEFATQLYAPKEKGPMYVWAVVRDNRGGQNWTRMKVIVR